MREDDQRVADRDVGKRQILDTAILPAVRDCRTPSGERFESERGPAAGRRFECLSTGQHDRRERARQRSTIESPFTGEHFVQHHAEGEHV